MADIKLVCSHCGKEMYVSEHVSVPSLPCASCKQDVPLPGQTRASTTLGLRKPPPPPPEPAPEEARASLKTRRNEPPGPPRPVESRSVKRAAWRSRQRHKAMLSTLHLTLSVILFIVLAAAVAYFRFLYAPGLPEHEFARIREYGVWILGGAYLAIVIAAVQDNMFDALLCLVVPLYVFYYLFMVSSAVYLRAIVAALLIGFGYDFAVFAQVQSERAYEAVNHWIVTQ
jgi:hypothetical protein